MIGLNSLYHSFKELQQITASSEAGERRADKLFQVWLTNHQELWILVHIEVQSQYESAFSKRMYIYNYRAFDLYEKPVISVAVLGDERSSWRPTSFGYSYGGCEVSLKFPVVKLLDYEAQWEVLETNSNPFARVVMAHLKTLATTGNPVKREEWKWRLIRQLYELGYSNENIVKLFKVIDKMMTLPKELQQKLNTKIRNYEEERTMPLLSTMEEMAVETGALRNARDSVIRVLQARLGEVPSEVAESLNNLSDLSVLQQLLSKAATVNSLEEFQPYLRVD